jgi:hypothetical protein
MFGRQYFTRLISVRQAPVRTRFFTTHGRGKAHHLGAPVLPTSGAPSRAYRKGLDLMRASPRKRGGYLFYARFTTKRGGGAPLTQTPLPSPSLPRPRLLPHPSPLHPGAPVPPTSGPLRPFGPPPRRAGRTLTALLFPRASPPCVAEAHRLLRHLFPVRPTRAPLPPRATTPASQPVPSARYSHPACSATPDGTK